MKISVVTIVKNNKSSIRCAVESVLSQRDIELEYIVIDGESTDGTLDILKEYGDRISVLVSEKDKSLYHALNKGVALATGDVVAILHSDDMFASDTVLCDVASCFESGGYSMVFGDIAIVEQDDVDRVVRYWKSSPYRRYKLFFGWMPPHPGLFVRRELYAEYGDFATDLRIAADYDLILRFMLAEGKKSHYLPMMMVRMRAGGASRNTVSNTVKKIKEDLFVVRKNRVGGLFTVVFKRLAKMHQYLPVGRSK